MLRGFGRTRPAALLLVIAAAVVVAGCQPRTGLQGGRTPITLPPAQNVETPLVADENNRPIVPDAIKGKQVYEQNCAVCHGMDGHGNGPMAPTLVEPQHDVLALVVGLFGITIHRPTVPSKPADFHNRDLESVITPAIMFQTVTDGRAYTAMPAFGPEPSFGANKQQTLTNADRWDANVYEMMFRATPEGLSAGKRLYEAQCAQCHGVNGDGKGPRGQEMAAQIWSWSRNEGPGIFTDINYMVQRNGADLTNAILDGGGPMPSYRGKLSTAEVNSLVDYINTFFFKHPPIK
ncbi:MAG TPA: c-type cytochrome [bacterium]|nr:c-type cytochrome [bacterium]